MSDKDEAIQRFNESRLAFRARIEDLTDGAYGEVWLGSWNLSQLLAHTSGWLREMAPGFERVSRGERATAPGADYSDFDAWNARFAETAIPGSLALKDFDEACNEYVAQALVLSEEHYGVDAERSGPRIGNRLLEGAGIGHFIEHGEQIEEWLKSRIRGV